MLVILRLKTKLLYCILQGHNYPQYREHIYQHIITFPVNVAAPELMVVLLPKYVTHFS